MTNSHHDSGNTPAVDVHLINFNIPRVPRTFGSLGSPVESGHWFDGGSDETL